MTSTGTSPQRRSPRASARTSGALALIALACLQSAPVQAQARTVLGIRGGAALVRGGRAVYAGQVEVVDMDGGSSVELALTGWTELHVTGEYRYGNLSPVHAHAEALSIWGGGLLASYLWRHSRQSFGPYVLLGLGIGPLWVDWRVDSTDPLFGTPSPGGGSFRAEERVTVGTLLSLGIGQRLIERLDVRAQMLMVLVPSTDAREQMKKVPLLTLTSGIGL